VTDDRYQLGDLAPIGFDGKNQRHRIRSSP
jgi:hypothetical protein